MDCAFAIQGKDFILMASDRSVARSIVKLQDSDDKMKILSDNQIMAACGEVSDRKSFTKLVSCELEYYYYVHGNRLNTDEVANFTRTTMAENLRKSPVQANVIIAGYDIDGPKLYWMDYLGSSQKVTKAAHGYGGHFLYGIMDNFYKKDFDYDTAVECVRACIFELKKRFLISLVDFTVYRVTSEGLREISDEFNIVVNPKISK
jgi:20S proteasome subunit beta 4